jgi:hypothetical protein
VAPRRAAAKKLTGRHRAAAELFTFDSRFKSFVVGADVGEQAAWLDASL